MRCRDSNISTSFAQVAGAAEGEGGGAHPAAEGLQQAAPARTREEGAQSVAQEPEIHPMTQLHISDDSTASVLPPASSSVTAFTGKAGSPSREAAAGSPAPGSSRGQQSEQSLQQAPQRARPALSLPEEGSADSENVCAGEGTPSSCAPPSPHPQRGALSPLADAANLQNKPAGSQVTRALFRPLPRNYLPDHTLTIKSRPAGVHAHIFSSCSVSNAGDGSELQCM